MNIRYFIVESLLALAIFILVIGCLNGSWVIGALGFVATIVSSFTLMQIFIKEHSSV